MYMYILLPKINELATAMKLTDVLECQCISEVRKYIFAYPIQI